MFDRAQRAFCRALHADGVAAPGPGAGGHEGPGDRGGRRSAQDRRGPSSGQLPISLAFLAPRGPRHRDGADQQVPAACTAFHRPRRPRAQRISPPEVRRRAALGLAVLRSHDRPQHQGLDADCGRAQRVPLRAGRARTRGGVGGRVLPQCRSAGGGIDAGRHPWRHSRRSIERDLRRLSAEPPAGRGAGRRAQSRVPARPGLGRQFAGSGHARAHRSSATWDDFRTRGPAYHRYAGQAAKMRGLQSYVLFREPGRPSRKSSGGLLAVPSQPGAPAAAAGARRGAHRQDCAHLLANGSLPPQGPPCALRAHQRRRAEELAGRSPPDPR